MAFMTWRAVHISPSHTAARAQSASALLPVPSLVFLYVCLLGAQPSKGPQAPLRTEARREGVHFAAEFLIFVC